MCPMGLPLRQPTSFDGVAAGRDKLRTHVSHFTFSPFFWLLKRIPKKKLSMVLDSPHRALHPVNVSSQTLTASMEALTSLCAVVVLTYSVCEDTANGVPVFHLRLQRQCGARICGKNIDVKNNTRQMAFALRWQYGAHNSKHSPIDVDAGLL